MILIITRRKFLLSELKRLIADVDSIYCELADQYKLLDAASAIAKRHVLADHLKEVIDTLEQKVSLIIFFLDLLYRRRSSWDSADHIGRSDIFLIRSPQFPGSTRYSECEFSQSKSEQECWGRNADGAGDVRG